MAADRLPSPIAWANSFASHQMNAANRGCGGVFRAKKTGAIDRVGVCWQNYSTGPTFRIGIESLSGRAPTGTYLGGGLAYGSQVNPPTGLTITTLGAQVPVTEGDLYATTVRYLSGTLSNDQYAMHYINALDGSSTFIPYSIRLIAGVWDTVAALGRIAPIYTDGDVEDFAFLSADAFAATNNWNSAASPLYRGQGMTMAVTKRSVGVWLRITATATSDFRVRLFKEGVATPLSSQTVIIASQWQSTNNGLSFIRMPAATCDAGSTYFWVVEPITTNAITNVFHMTHPSLLALQAVNGSMFGVTGTGALVWTKYNNVSDGFRRYTIIPEFDDTTIYVPTASDLRSGVTVGSVTGTLTLPADDDVRLNVQYGGGGNELTGTVVLPNPSDVRLDTSFGADGSQYVGTMLGAAATESPPQQGELSLEEVGYTRRDAVLKHIRDVCEKLNNGRYHVVRGGVNWVKWNFKQHKYGIAVVVDEGSFLREQNDATITLEFMTELSGTAPAPGKLKDSIIDEMVVDATLAFERICDPDVRDPNDPGMPLILMVDRESDTLMEVTDVIHMCHGIFVSAEIRY